MSINKDVSNSEGMSNSDAKISNVEVQIIRLCIKYHTIGNSYWNPNIGQFTYYKIGCFPTHSFVQGRFHSCRFIITFLNWRNCLPWRSLVKKTRDHIVGRTIFNMKVTLVDSVGNKKIPDIQMFSYLGTGSSSVVLEENCRQ